MSLVSSRVALIHRCVIERDANAGAGEWGSPAAPDWQQHLAAQPCRVWSSAGREIADDNETVVIEDTRMLLPLDTDVTENDRVGDVTHRGATILGGPVQIRAILRRRDFLEIVLVRLH